MAEESMKREVASQWNSAIGGQWVEKMRPLWKGARHTTARMGKQGVAAAHLLLFPVLLAYLELVIHLAVGMDLGYAPVWLAFSLAAGCLLSALVLALPPRAGGVAAKVAAGLITLLYAVELAAKAVLQTFYPLSILETAAGNFLQKNVVSAII